MNLYQSFLAKLQLLGLFLLRAQLCCVGIIMCVAFSAIGQNTPNNPLKLSLSTTTPERTSDSTFRVKMSVVLKNTGNSDLSNVIMAHNLTSLLYQNAKSWEFQDKPILLYGRVVSNSFFNGLTDTLLITNGQNPLTQGDSIGIEYTLTVNTPLKDTLYTQANASAQTSNATTFKVLSNNVENTNSDTPKANALVFGIGDFFMPDGFSPNGDGINDKLVVRSINPGERMELKVYNRWGNLVYASNDYLNDWDGTSNQGVTLIGGEGIADGSYFYSVARFDRTTNNVITTNGKAMVVKFLTIIR